MLNPGTIWITGLPAAGKTTVANSVYQWILAQDGRAFILDGDEVRTGLCADLGFSREDRAEQVRRVAYMATILVQSGTIAIVALISPYAEDREKARSIHQQKGLDFYEIWVNTPLHICEERDPKGLYAAARAGTLQGLTGIDAPYENPTNPDFVIEAYKA